MSSSTFYIDPITNAATFNGNAVVSGNLTSANQVNFRNRVINGDMRIDQRGGQGTTGSGAGSSTSTISTTYGVDRWAIATGAASGTAAATQIALTAADQAAVGGAFTNAAAVGVVPNDNLAIYYPFDGNLNDLSGNGNTLTVTGSVSYAPGRVGSNAVYLANDANIGASPTAATNYLRNTSYVFNQTFSVSLWMLATTINTSTNGFIFCTNSGNTNLNNSITISIRNIAGSPIVSNFATGTVITGPNAIANIWYHVAVTIVNGSTLTLYVNGTSYGSITGTLAQAGYMFGNASITATQPFAGFIDDFRIYNRALSATEIAALAGIAPIYQTPATTLASGLTTRLTFDNTTVDAQGTLSLPSGTPIYSAISKSGTRCLDCTGTVIGTSESSSLIYSGVSASLPITMAYWFNSSTLSASYQAIVCIGSSTTWGLEHMIYSNGILYVDAYVSGTNYQTPTNIVSITANTWYHVCSTVTSAGYHVLYINGVQVASKSVGAGTSLTANNGGAITTLKIGGQIGNTTTGFKGLIDDFRQYNRALSPQEVAGLYYSYQPAPYILYQQPIEGLNVADLGWGTSAAQSATVSAWIKNNTASAQQFSLSAGNAGAAAAITAITFESGVDDTLGFLTNATALGTTTYSTTAGLYKVGTRALDLTANTAAGSTATTNVSYMCSITTPPITLSAWIYVTSPTGGNYQVLCCFGNSVANNFSYQFVMGLAGQMGIDCWIGATNYSISFASSSAIAASTWTHVCTTVSYNDTVKLYINGILVGSSSSSVPSNSVFSCYNSSSTPINAFRIGSQYASPNNSFRGYIDDVRIYNRALTSAEVYQLYAKNATSTTISQYLLPRSYLYTTPSISAGAWQKITFTIPGDSTDAAWAKDITCGLNLALCLGAGAAYTHPSAMSGWSSAKYFTGAGIQAFSAAATNFLADPTNSIYITGVQLEKGDVTTTFEVRPFALESQLCQRYFQQQTIAAAGAFGGGNGSVAIVSYNYPVALRVPVISMTLINGGIAADGIADINITGLVSTLPISSTTTSGCLLFFVASLSASGRGCYIRNTILAFSSEL